MFKKNKQNLLWNFINKNLEGYFELDDYFEKSINHLPGWYSKIKANKSTPFKSFGHSESSSNIKTCPSFVDLFKNSLIFKCPIDVDIKISKNKFDYVVPTGSHPMLSITSHTMVEEKTGSQMGQYWNNNIQNIKFSLPLTMWTSQKKTKLIFLSNFYFNPRQEMQVAPGIVDFLPSNPLEMSVNFFIDLKDHEEKTINLKSNEPLALMYFPEGLPELKRGYETQKLRKKFYGDWTSRVKKYDNNY